jgi:hypothetical protein
VSVEDVSEEDGVRAARGYGSGMMVVEVSFVFD